jgi:hypothetical protein
LTFFEFSVIFKKMNIFILDKNPCKAAQYYADKHIPKMCVELFQQLGSAIIRHGAKPEQMPLTSKGTHLKGGYHNHPCTRWCGDTRINFMWASSHAIELCKEYTKRYGKIHSCEKGIRQLVEMQHMIPEGPLTNYALAMPDKYKTNDPVQSYRTYYLNDKKSFAKWNKLNNTPYWWNVS